MTDTFVISGAGSSVKATILKDPDAVLDYTFDWTAWLAGIADTLASQQMVVDTGITLNSSSIDGSKVIAWLSGGTAGTTYRVTCRVVTAGGRTDDRSIYIKIVER